MCRLFGVEQCHLSPLRTLCLSLCCHAHAPGMGAGNSIPCQVGNSAFLLDGALLGAAGGEKVRVCAAGDCSTFPAQRPDPVSLVPAGPDHVIVVLNAHGQGQSSGAHEKLCRALTVLARSSRSSPGCACCCPNCLCRDCCIPEPVRYEVFAQRPFGAVGGAGHRSEVSVAINQWALSPLGLPPQLQGRVQPQIWQQFIAQVSLLYMQNTKAAPAAQQAALVQVEQAFGPLLGCSGIANGMYPYEYWHDGGENDPSGWRRHERYFIRIDWPPLTMPAAGVPMATAPVCQPGMQASAAVTQQQVPRMVPL